jgi:hypothetical protein
VEVSDERSLEIVEFIENYRRIIEGPAGTWKGGGCIFTI